MPVQRLPLCYCALPMLGLCAALVSACGPVPYLAPASLPGHETSIVVAFDPAAAMSARAALRERYAAHDAVVLLPNVECWQLRSAADLPALALDSAVNFAHANHRRWLTLPEVDADHTGTQMHGGENGAWSIEPPSNDPGAALQWHLPAAGFPEAWGRASGAGVTVAVIDSGIDPNHPDLRPNLLPLIDEVVALGGEDVVGGERYDGRDGHGHGTHVSGLIAAVLGNSIGVAGAAPRVKVLPVKVTAASGATDDATIAKGIGDAVEAGAQVLNLSIGGAAPSPVLLEALNYAFTRGATVVIAAGNDGGAVMYPAAYDGVVSVGATTADGAVAAYSSRGPGLVLVAPGGGPKDGQLGPALFSTLPTYRVLLNQEEATVTGYGYAAGTSMSAPLVSAAAALLLETEPTLTGPQVRTRLAAAAGAGTHDNALGYGRLDAFRALELR